MAARAFLIPSGSSEHCFWAHAALQGSWLIRSTAVQHFLADPETPNSPLPSRCPGTPNSTSSVQTQSLALRLFFSPGNPALANCTVWSVTEKSAALSRRLPLSSLALLLPSHFLPRRMLELTHLEVILFTLYFLSVEISSTLMILLMLI